MSKFHNTSPPSPKSNPFSTITNAHLAAGLSKSSRLLLAQMVIWAGKKGYHWWSVPKMAAAFGVSDSTIRRSLRELQGVGLLAIIPRPGRSSYLIPYPDQQEGAVANLPVRSQEKAAPRTDPAENDQAPLSKLTPPLEKKKEKEKTFYVGQLTPQLLPYPSEAPTLLPNVNALKTSSPESLPTTFPNCSPLSSPELQPPPTSDEHLQPPHKPDLTYLVEDIEQTTKDFHSRGAFLRISREVDEQTIFQALSITRLAMNEQTINRPGAYFINTIKALSDFHFSSRETTPSHMNSSTPPQLDPSLEESLAHLQALHPKILVSDLFHRYCELKDDGTPSLVTSTHLKSFRRFLAQHHQTIYDQKTQYRVND